MIINKFLAFLPSLLIFLLLTNGVNVRRNMKNGYLNKNLRVLCELCEKPVPHKDLERILIDIIAFI